MVHLSAPEPGTWRVERASSGADDVAIIGASTLSLAVALSPGYLEAGEPLLIQARLQEHDQPLREFQRLQAFTVQAELTTPAGHRQTIPLHLNPETGEFTATSTTPAADGQYGLVVVATSATVQRQRTLSFLPQSRCFIPHVQADTAVTVRVTLTDACPEFDHLEIAAGYAAEHDHTSITWAAMAETAARQFQAVLPPPATAATRSVLLRIGGQRGRQAAFTISKGPFPVPVVVASPPPVVPEAPFDWYALARTVSWQLLVLNLCLGVCGGWYCFYRYRIRNRRRANA
jgi:hypothetical protein